MKRYLILFVALLMYSEIVIAAPFAYVTNTDSKNVSVINVATKEKISTVDVGARPEAIAASVDGKFVYVANAGPKNVSVIEVSSNMVVDTIDVNNNPLGIAASPDGDFVYVTNSGSDNVSIIDTSSNEVVGTVSLGDFPVGVTFTPDSKFAYVVVSENNVVAVIEVSSMEVVKTIKEVGNLPNCIAIDPEGNFAYVSDTNGVAITIIDLSTNEVSGSISLASVNDCCFGTCLQVTPDGSSLYVAYATKVVAIDLSTNQVVKTINTNGNGEAQCLAITPDGEFVYVSNFDPTGITPDPPISIIEVSSNTVVDESIVAGDQPYAISITPEADSETPDPEGSSSDGGSCSLAQAGPTNYSFLLLIITMGLFIAVRITRTRSDSL